VSFALEHQWNRRWRLYFSEWNLFEQGMVPGLGSDWVVWRWRCSCNRRYPPGDSDILDGPGADLQHFTGNRLEGSDIDCARGGVCNSRSRQIALMKRLHRACLIAALN